MIREILHNQEEILVKKFTLLKTTAVIAALALASVASASPRFAQKNANAPSYDSVGIGYVNVDFDGVSNKADGYVFSLEKRLTTNWYASASFSDLDVEDISQSYKSYLVGLGYTHAMNRSTSLDLFGGFAKEKFGLLSESGYQIGIGMRQRVGDLQWSITPTYTDLGNDLDQFSVSVGGEYFLSANMALGARVSIAEDSNSYTLGFRYHF